jgi:hypothetical protein
MWFWFGLEFLRLVYKKRFLKYWMVSILLWPFCLEKDNTVPYQSCQKISSKLSAKGIKRSGILRWSLASRSSQRLFKRFFATISFSVQKFFPFVKLETSAHFWNSASFDTLYGLFWRNFSTHIRGGATFFGGLKVKNDRNQSGTIEYSRQTGTI